MKKEVYEAFDGKTVLVTGGAGAIGSNLVKALSQLETKKIIICMDNNFIRTAKNSLIVIFQSIR